MQSKLEQKKEEDNANYWFILKCLGAITAAAVITAGIIVAVAAKASVATLAGVATSAVLAGPIAPLAGLLVLIGAVCLLPFLFVGDSCARVSTQSYGLVYGRSYQPTFYPPTPVIIGGGGYGNSHQHGHGGVFGGSTGGTVHGHDGGGHGHSHSHPHPR